MRLLVLFSALLFHLSLSAQAASVSAPQAQTRKLMQMGGDDSVINRKTHVAKLKGNAYIYRESEVIKADYIELNTELEQVHAEGRVQYQYGDYLIRADSIDVDLRSKAGTVINGSITNGAFALSGSKIEQTEPNHFLVEDYNYTTCHDCPNSWQMTGSRGDFTIEGYAVMRDFVFRIKDAALLYAPYMIIPIKTKRQSGLLFPKFGSNTAYGAYIVQPYYWAINSWSDLTAGAGIYTRSGARFETEARYALTPRSQGSINLFWTHDQDIKNLFFRYAGRAAITQELPLGVEGKLRINEVSDSGYPTTYVDDVPGRYEPVLASDLFFSRNDPNLSTTVSFRRIRNLFRFEDGGLDAKGASITNYTAGFDNTTVQEFPRIVINTNDRFVFGQKLAFGVEARFNRFARAAGPFDVIPNSNRPPTVAVREANRFTFIPDLYTTLNPWPWLSLVPSVQYRSFFYNFNGAQNEKGVYPNLTRGYLLGQAEMSAQLERVYQTGNPNISFKHTIRPTLTYSVIPSAATIEPKHPFITQVQNTFYPGQYFDNWDIVPTNPTLNLDSYFAPQANSLTYGMVSQVFRRESSTDGGVKVARRFEAGVSQTLDISTAKRVLDNPTIDNRIILSPLFSHLIYQEDQFYAGLDYSYISFLERYQQSEGAHLLKYPNAHRVSSTLSWTFEHSLKDGILAFDRSVYANYSFSKLTSRVSSLQFGATFSINDYIMPKGSLSYNLANVDTVQHLSQAVASVIFQNPSRCWQIEVGFYKSVDRGDGTILNFALNTAGNVATPVDDSLKN